jgi:hypothetical protein
MQILLHSQKFSLLGLQHPLRQQRTNRSLNLRETT